MYLSELFNHLSYSELTQLSVGGEPQGVINSANQANIITHLNLGLLELYKRFPIKLNSVSIQQTLGITNYVLDSSYAVTNPKSTDDVAFPKYIIDSAEAPFTDDVLMIDRIVDELNEELPFNDENYSNSIITLDYNVINVPEPELEYLITVSYRATPPKIAIDTFDADTTQIPIGSQYLEALINFIAYRCFASFSQNSPETVNYYQRFEMACNLIRREGLVYKDLPRNVRLDNQGWL